MRRAAERHGGKKLIKWARAGLAVNFQSQPINPAPCSIWSDAVGRAARANTLLRMREKCICPLPWGKRADRTLCSTNSGSGTVEDVRARLRDVRDPDLQSDVVTLEFIKSIDIEGSVVSFDLVLNTPAYPTRDVLKEACVDAVKALPWVTNVNVRLVVENRGKQRQDPKAQVRQCVIQPPPSSAVPVSLPLPEAASFSSCFSSCP